MNPLSLYINRVLPFFTGQSKHSLDSKRPHLFAEFGYPESLTFHDYYNAYKRNGIGRAGVMRHIERTWCSNPEILETEDDHEKTQWEKVVLEMAERVRLWKALEGVDKRNRVGKYAGLIFRYADGKRFDEPVDRVPGGIDGLVGLIPAWESQLEPAEWDDDPQSINYGMPKMYHYNEATIGDLDSRNPGRVMRVHPDRVYIWAEGADDGSIFGEPALEAGFNNLVDIEKILGSGGEGFWKTARASMKLNIDADADMNTLAAMLGVAIEDLGEALDEEMKKFLSGADKSFISQGIDPQNLTITLPADPQNYLLGPLQAFSASVTIPLRVLIGSQSGERASTEDREEWDGTITSRRERFVIPAIREIFRRWMAVGIIPAKEDFYVDWADLAAPSIKDKLENAKAMAETNKALLGTDDYAFTGEEIRAMVDYDPLGAEDLPDDADPEDEEEEDAPEN